MMQFLNLINAESIKFREDDVNSDSGATTTASFVFKPHYLVYSVFT